MLTPKPPCRSTQTFEELKLLNFLPPRLNSPRTAYRHQITSHISRGSSFLRSATDTFLYRSSRPRSAPRNSLAGFTISLHYVHHRLYSVLTVSTKMLIGTVECAHAVASESAISDHMTTPELPEPDDATQAMQSQPFAFPTRRSSSSPRSSRFPHLLPSLSANQTQATFSQDAPLATHQAPSAEETRITHIGPANDKPEDDTAPHCTRSALPSPTILRSGPIRKDSE